MLGCHDMPLTERLPWQNHLPSPARGLTWTCGRDSAGANAPSRSRLPRNYFWVARITTCESTSCLTQSVFALGAKFLAFLTSPQATSAAPKQTRPSVTSRGFMELGLAFNPVRRRMPACWGVMISPNGKTSLAEPLAVHPRRLTSTRRQGFRWRKRSLNGRGSDTSAAHPTLLK